MKKIKAGPRAADGKNTTSEPASSPALRQGAAKPLQLEPQQRVRGDDCVCPPPTLSQSDVALLLGPYGRTGNGIGPQEAPYGACLAALFSESPLEDYELLDVMLVAGYVPEVPELAVEASFLVTKAKIQKFLEEGDTCSALEWLREEPRGLVQVATRLLNQAAELQAMHWTIQQK